MPFFDLGCARPIPGFRLSGQRSDPAEKLSRRLDALAAVVFDKVPALQDLQGVPAELRSLPGCRYDFKLAHKKYQLLNAITGLGLPQPPEAKDVANPFRKS
jgi:hypothetical protein